MHHRGLGRSPKGRAHDDESISKKSPFNLNRKKATREKVAFDFVEK